MSDLSNKVILTVATTSAWPKKENTPYVPITPTEIAEEVYACWKAGASMAHIHVRDDEANASMDYDKFEETVNLICARKDCDIVLNLTTSGGIGLADDVRMKPFIELKPELASYDCGSMNWQNNCVFENSPAFLEKLGNTMQEAGVKPEIEIFDVGMIYNALYYLKNLIPGGSTWSALGIGKGHLPIMYAALALGGNIRVGMEDNILYGKGQLATSNVEFVERAKRVIEDFGKEVATPDETRQILGV